MLLPACSNLSNLPQYLKRYPRGEAASFEYLVASAFSQILHVPFQSANNKDDKVKYRVIWQGSIDRKNKLISKAKSGLDSVCFAYGYYILVECTLRVGANQWRKEFVESLKHYDQFISNKSVPQKDVYLSVAAPKLHKDTYTGFQQKAREGMNVILFESPLLGKISDTCKIISTVTHLDLRQLFNDMIKELRESTSFYRFKQLLPKCISEWQRGVLIREKTVFFGLRSYEAMKKVRRNIVGTSDILFHLHKDRKFNHYMKILGGGDLNFYIKEALLSERLAYLITTPDEDLFCKINSLDFKERGLRLIKEVEAING